MRRVVIYGVGSWMVVDIEETCRRLGVEVAAGIRNVDAPSRVSESVPIVEAEAAPDALRDLGIVVPIFTPAHRKAALADARQRGFARAETLIDPTSPVASSAALGAGVYVNAGCTIGGCARLADHVFVNRGASLGHHVALDEYAAVGPGAVLSGHVKLGRGAMVGAGAVVLPHVEIGENAVVGAGAVVTQPVPARCLAVGSPARIAKTDIAGFNGLAV